jgi:lipoyl-dependent peroxiredoxin
MQRALTGRETEDGARHATARWLCHPPSGSGHLHSDSRAFEGLRFSAPDGPPQAEATTPGELLAAAYAGFVSTYLGQRLEDDGLPASELVVDVWCHLSPPHQTPRAIEHVQVEVSGRVKGLDEQGFERAAQAAWAACVQALALDGGVHSELQVSLKG